MEYAALPFGIGVGWMVNGVGRRKEMEGKDEWEVEGEVEGNDENSGDERASG